MSAQPTEPTCRKTYKEKLRRKKGSKRRRTAVQVLAKQHQKVKRQRSDFHHKTAPALVRQYDTIYVEAIQPSNLSRRPAPKPDEKGNGHRGYIHNGASHKAGLNKSIQDAGWRHFLSILAFKAACAGKRVEAVSPAYTSQDLFRLWQTELQEPVRAHPRVYELWPHSRSG
jgi:putative transposase